MVGSVGLEPTTLCFRQLLKGLWGDLRVLDQRMTELDRQIAVMASNTAKAGRWQQPLD